jgi:hypothetical protein
VSPLDQTSALHTLMWHPLRCCTMCGRTRALQGGVWLCHEPGVRLAVAFALCDPCRITDPKLVALDTLLKRRYGIGEEVVSRLASG